MGISLFGRNSATFGLNGLKIFMGIQETIIYELAMRNSSYDAYSLFKYINKEPTSSVIGMAIMIMMAINGLGPLNPTKKLAHLLNLLSQLLTQNRVFEISRPELP